jgi:hypothetical protein
MRRNTPFPFLAEFAPYAPLFFVLAHWAAIGYNTVY